MEDEDEDEEQPGSAAFYRLLQAVNARMREAPARVSSTLPMTLVDQPPSASISAHSS